MQAEVKHIRDKKLGGKCPHKLLYVRDYSKIESLYDKLKGNRITETELDELFSMLDLKHGRKLYDAEMKKVWNQKNTIPVNAQMRIRIQELKDQVKSENRRERYTGRWLGSNLRLIGSIAASMVILVTLLFASGIFNRKIEYHTDYGEREKVTLPDGSVVELNANTSLVWDKQWRKSNIREVILEGEAFFEVTHTVDNKKFVVKTNDLDVEVLGTSFNVSNRHKNTVVFLEEGSVRLDLKGASPQGITMNPGQEFSYSRDKELLLESREQDPETMASWKNNVLYFNDKTVEEILREISAIYGVRFEYSDPGIRERKLNFWVPYSDWETTKEAFELTMKLNIQEKDGVYVVGKK